jgi:hypothetical protein
MHILNIVRSCSIIIEDVMTSDNGDFKKFYMYAFKKTENEYENFFSIVKFYRILFAHNI